jgi:hypothetical protein
VTVLLVIALWLVLPTEASGGGPDEAPADILERGRQVGCLVPTRKLSGVISIWVIEREAGTAHAAWCTRQRAGEPVYDLVVSAPARHPWGRCPAHIRIGVEKPFPYFRVRMLPRDLPYPMKITEFWFVRGDTYVLQGPPVRGSMQPKGPALDIGEEDAGQFLLCFDGSWIMSGYH